MKPRVAVIIPCHRDGALVAQAVQSIQESEPVEIVVVDDASPDEDTRAALARLERTGVRVLRHASRRGPGPARTTGIAATSAPFIYPLDADDLALPGILAKMADALEGDTQAAACVGDIAEFGDRTVIRVTPPRLDPYRVAYRNEYPVTALFRRSSIEAAGGYRRLSDEHMGYEDWGLWMSLAERGERIVHIGSPGYRRRLHGRRLNHIAAAGHREHYAAMRAAYPDLFARLPEHRRTSDLSAAGKLLYPLVFGERPAVPFERRLKPWFDRAGLLTRAQRR